MLKVALAVLACTRVLEFVNSRDDHRRAEEGVLVEVLEEKTTAAAAAEAAAAAKDSSKILPLAAAADAAAAAMNNKTKQKRPCYQHAPPKVKRSLLIHLADHITRTNVRPANRTDVNSC